MYQSQNRFLSMNKTNYHNFKKQKFYIIAVVLTIFCVLILLSYWKNIGDYFQVNIGEVINKYVPAEDIKIVALDLQNSNNKLPSGVVVEFLANNKKYKTIIANYESVNKYSGTITEEDGEEKTKKDFIVENDVLYVREKDQFDNKYVIWSKEAYPELAVQLPSDIANINQSEVDAKRKKLLINNVEATASIMTYFEDPSVPLLQSVDMVIDGDTLLVKKAVILSQLPEGSGTYTKIIKYKYNSKNIKITLPSDDEITK